MSGEVCQDCGLPWAKSLAYWLYGSEPATCAARFEEVDDSDANDVMAARCSCLELTRNRLKSQLASARRENECWRALAEYAAPGERAFMFGLYKGARRMAPQSAVKFEPLGIGPDFGAAAIDLATKLGLIPGDKP